MGSGEIVVAGADGDVGGVLEEVGDVGILVVGHDENDPVVDEMSRRRRWRVLVLGTIWISLRGCLFLGFG
jgi:hypothetical protein